MYEAQKKWNKENRDKVNAYKKKWRATPGQKEKEHQQQKQYRAKNPEEWRKRMRERVRKIYERNKLWMRAYKELQECELCGEKDPHLLYFHHKKPRKGDDRAVSEFLWGASLDRIVKEIEKCRVLCASCHTKLHVDVKKAHEAAS